MKQLTIWLAFGILNAATHLAYGQEQMATMGLGLVAPDFFSRKVFYFYSGPNLDKSVSEHAPSDSLVFVQTEHHQYDITYAPPWFFPEHIKMDYEILYLKVLVQGRDWLQVEVNKQSGQAAWIDASELRLIPWAEFLLKVNSIENPDLKNNPLRVRPLAHGGLWQGPEYQFMMPMMITESWIKVSLRDNDLKTVGEAWLQWRNADKLLITYNLLF